MEYYRGSEWRRWELHMHTPFTTKSDKFTGATVDEKWNKFYEDISKYISDGSNLANNISAIAITDYLSIDNYEKVKKDSRLPETVKLLLPNVEMRMQPHSGDSPVNIHCIFNPNIDSEIHDRFFSKLCFDNGDRSYSATRTGLISLGRKHKNDTSLEENTAYKVGINQFVITIESLKKVFEKDPDLKEDTIIVVSNSSQDGATGIIKHSDYFISKTESQLEATRRSIYKLSDAIFSSSKSDRKYFSGNGPDSREMVIQKCGSLKPCIHGCDAHENKKIFAPDLDRFCWIKADPTFEGLKQILIEPLERVFIGEIPDSLKRATSHSTKYITHLSINRSPGATSSESGWFENCEIPINNDLVAIIGNKGSGKSAISDIIGLCGNSKHYQDFSFLNKNRFLKGDLASKFQAEIKFLNNISTDAVKLNEQTDETEDSRVLYLPQNYFEEVCNEIEKVEALRIEIENVVFQYIPNDKKYGKHSFKDLISYQSQSIDSEIQKYKINIEELNKEIVNIEEKINPSYKKTIESKIRQKQEELAAHDSTKPKEIVFDEKAKDKPENSQYAEELKSWAEKLKTANSDFNNVSEEVDQIAIEVQDLINFKSELDLLVNEINEYLSQNEDLITENFGSSKSLIDIKFNSSLIDKSIKSKREKLKKLHVQLGNNEYVESIHYEKLSINAKIQKCDDMIKEIKTKLSLEEQKIHKYKSNLLDWEETRKKLIGDIKTPETLNYFKNELVQANEILPALLKEKRQDRVNISLKIYDAQNLVKKIYDDVKAEISTVLDENGEGRLTITSSFSISPDFTNKFLDNVNNRASGSYKGRDESRNLIKNTLIANTDLDDRSSLEKFLNTTIYYFENNEGIENKTDRFIGDQLKNAQAFYDYLFKLSYLSPNYELCQDEKKLNELSPGEKGALLLVFYLVLDKNDIPLIIDQPEDNLDNHSVANILVPYIKRAKKNRQIILVTHNPNLAIVSDAEQIICVDIDKCNNNLFSFDSGSIENPIINKKIVDILEGTMPAFQTREHKYLK